MYKKRRLFKIILMIKKNFLFLFLLLSFSNLYGYDAFVFEKPCPLYEINGENYKKIGKLEENKNYQFKNFKQIKKKNYAIIEDENHKEIYVNKNCGYQKFEEKPKLEKIFTDSEIEKLKSINEFDEEILNFCGYFGSHPTKEQFIEILSKEKYRQDFDYIYNQLNKKILSSSQNDEDKNEFLINLVNILFKTGGFVHTSCGFVRGEKLAGPHYYYRFLDLQKNGFIGKNTLKNCGKKESTSQSSVIKNYDLTFFDTNKNLHSKCNNSFVENLEIKDLIIIAAQIGKLPIENNQSNEKKIKTEKIKSFIYRKIFDNEEISFKIVYNDEKKSLITLYPITEK
jgi:hypothetical protein